MSLRRIFVRGSHLFPLRPPHPHPRFSSTHPSKPPTTTTTTNPQPSSKPPTPQIPPNTKPNATRPNTPNTNVNPPNPNTSKTQTRLHTLLSHLPTPLHRYTTPLLSAPLTHITSFLILHELTAILPLLGLASWFHWGNGMSYLPGWVVENRWIPEGMERFGRWFRRRGWFGFGGEGEVEGGGVGGVLVGEDGVIVGKDGQGNGKGVIVGGDGGEKGKMGKREMIWTVGEKGSRILVEVATAYAITKVLLPVRVVVSVWATPWFARVVLGVFRRGRKGKGS